MTKLTSDLLELPFYQDSGGISNIMSKFRDGTRELLSATGKA